MKTDYRLFLSCIICLLGMPLAAAEIEDCPTHLTERKTPSSLEEALSYPSIFRTTSPLATASLPPTYEEMVSSMIEIGKRFLGKPYRYKASKKWVMDCSGFVGYIFSCFDIKLPRSSAGISSYSVSVKNPQPGDLLFFKGRNARSGRVGHVAMVVSVDGKDITMMHSSCQKGIVIEKMNRSAYFSRRYVGAGRIPELHTMLQKENKGNNTPTLQEQEEVKPNLFHLQPVPMVHLPEAFSLVPPIDPKK